MRYSVPYGDTAMHFEAPEKNVFVASPKEPPQVLSDLEKAVREALAAPIGAKRISGMAGPGKKIVITVDDYTRPTPTARMLGPVVDEILAAGADLGDIHVIVAGGMHRQTTAQEAERILGPFVRTLGFSIHDSSKGPFVDFGRTSRGSRIRINERYARADVRICLGLIEPHRLAGWTGGRKSICPGVSGEETIQANHALSRECSLEVGVVEGNKLHEQMMEIAGKVGIDFILNVLLDEKHRPVGLFAGDWIEAHRRGMEKAGSFLKIEVPFAPDIEIISPGGYPPDSALWGIHGNAFTRSSILREGGVLIMVAECRAKFGHAQLEEWMKMKGGPRAIIEKAGQESFAFHIDKAAHLASLPDRFHVIMVSAGITRDEIPEFPYAYARDVQEALDMAWAKVGRDARIVVVPSAASTIPLLRPADGRAGS